MESSGGIMVKALRAVNLISEDGSTNMEIIKSELLNGKLHGITETVAIISSSPDADGISKAKEFNFPEERIYIVDERSGTFAEDLLWILDHHEIDFYHQLGWKPHTPKKVTAKYTGLNQHLGPGGRWMYGIRRVYAFMRFCEEIEDELLLPVFCQLVEQEYNSGGVVYLENVAIDFRKSPQEIAAQLLPIEHQVQIAGRLLYGSFQPVLPRLLPAIARNSKEEELLLAMKKEARNRYPPEWHKQEN